MRTALVIFLAFITLLTGEGPAVERRWNLLIVTADDLNADSMGWMGSALGATPALDAFASTCYRFEQAHVSAPICQPSRSALMTGRVPHRNGALGFNPIRLDVPTLVEVASAHGYFTAAINKTQHMQPKQKFNWDLVLEGSGKNPPAVGTDVQRAIRAASDAGKPFFINANITDPHRPFPGSEQEQTARARRNDRATGAVTPFIDSQVKIPEFLEELPRVRKEVAQYYTGVRRFDHSFASLMDALKSSSQQAHTVVVFCSDNGMSFPFSKATLFRSGTWSPILLRWPGMKKPYANKTDMVSNVDIMPTVLDLLKIEHPGGLDGQSLLPRMLGDQRSRRYHVFTHVNTVSSGKAFPGRCVRTLHSAYIWNSWPDGKTEFSAEAKSGLTFTALVEAAATNPKIRQRVESYLYRAKHELYDLKRDPAERTNVVQDPAYRKELARLRQLLFEHMKKTQDPLLQDFERETRHAESAAGVVIR